MSTDGSSLEWPCRPDTCLASAPRRVGMISPSALWKAGERLTREHTRVEWRRPVPSNENGGAINGTPQKWCAQ